MNPPYRPAPPPHVPSAPHGLPISASRPAGTPYQTSAPRASAPAHLLLNPTPTFSFADEPAPGPLYKPRRRSGGRFVLALLMLAAGAGGYLAVDSNGREQLQPYLKRAVELARSLKTLAPGASPETAAAPAEPKAAAPIPAEPPAPTVRPEVVPIPPAPAPARAADATAHATKVHHAAKHAPVAKARPTGKTSAALSDEAATEEALLAGPSGGR